MEEATQAILTALVAKPTLTSAIYFETLADVARHGPKWAACTRDRMRARLEEEGGTLDGGSFGVSVIPKGDGYVATIQCAPRATE